jgi:hypothetical protein
MATPSKLNLDELAASIVRCFPSLNLLEQNEAQYRDVLQ